MASNQKESCTLYYVLSFTARGIAEGPCHPITRYLTEAPVDVDEESSIRTLSSTPTYSCLLLP